MYSSMNVSQAAAGLGLTTRSYRDGVFSRGVSGLGATIRPVARTRSFRDGVFSAVGALDTLDLSDPNVMKEVKVAIGLWSPKDVNEAWFSDPTWDAKAEAKYMEFVKAQPPASGTLTTMVAGRATPNATGLYGLYLGAAQVIGADKAKTSLPILTDWVETTKGAGKVVAPKLAAQASLFGNKTLIGVGVGVAVIGLAYLAFKK